MFESLVICQKPDMETYATEITTNSRYLVKVVGPDGKPRASGNFATIGLAHAWIDKRRNAAATTAMNGDDGLVRTLSPYVVRPYNSPSNWSQNHASALRTLASSAFTGALSSG